MPARNTTTAELLRYLTFLHHDYVTGTTSIVDVQPGSPAPDELLAALRAANPNLLEVLRHRHGQLKRLGRRLLPKIQRRSRRPLSYLVGDGQDVDTSFPATPTPSPVRSEKTGRNDPCPCGSGRQFKCCGAA